ncbi:MAG: glycosyltransferase [bacterium]
MKNSPVKIVYLIDHLKSGGAQRSLYLLVRELDKKKYAPYIVSLGSDGDEDYSRKFKQIKVDVKVYNANKINTLFVLVNFYFLLLREKPDIIHTFLFHSDIVGRFLGGLTRVPIIISSIRGFDLWKKPWHYALSRFTARFTSKITGVSREHIDFSIKNEGIKPEQAVRIPNGVDLASLKQDNNCTQLKKELKIREDFLVVGFVGRLVIDKALDCLINAARAIVRQHPETMFLLVGDGPIRSELQKLVTDNGLDDNFMFLGFRDDIMQLLSILDVFVLPSIHEGSSNALLEAMAMKKAVVVTEVGGNKEAVNKECGMLVPPQDEKALTSAICKLLESCDLRQALGEAAGKRIRENFSLDRMVMSYQHLYEELLADHRT